MRYTVPNPTKYDSPRVSLSADNYRNPNPIRDEEPVLTDGTVSSRIGSDQNRFGTKCDLIRTGLEPVQNRLEPKFCANAPRQVFACVAKIKYIDPLISLSPILLFPSNLRLRYR